MSTPAERVAAERRVQELPETVTDPVALLKLATLIRSTRSADRVGNSTPPGDQPVDAVSGASRAQRGVGEVTATSDAALEAGAGVASTSTTSTKQKRAGGHQRAS